MFLRKFMPHAIQIRQTGGPEALNWTAVDVGEPGSGQVRLRQAAAGLNYIDVYHRTGHCPRPLPFIPGLEGAGTVEAVVLPKEYTRPALNAVMLGELIDLISGIELKADNGEAHKGVF
jgi:hypothetical protein